MGRQLLASAQGREAGKASRRQARSNFAISCSQAARPRVHLQQRPLPNVPARRFLEDLPKGPPSMPVEAVAPWH
eukprot:9548710-Heterocapsa_arctica.AAC.1